MKIGIVTFHQALNYGAILQTYALQRCIKDKFQDVTVETVNYQSPYFLDFYSIRQQISSNVLISALRTFNFVRKKKKFAAFTKRYIALSQNRYYADTIEAASGEYDLFITGSDQVWNPQLTQSDLNYWLKFAESSKRASYAASIGVSDWEDNVKQIAVPLLNDFSEISVRETSAAKILTNMGVQKSIETNIDPVLLLNESDWKDVCAQQKPRSKKYLFVFAVKRSHELLQKAIKCAAHKNLEVVYVGPYIHQKGITYIPGPNVEKVLALFRDAEGVYTNSFHGTAFSILFRQRFFSHLENADSKNSRIVDLLHVLELENRLQESCLDTEINWMEVEQKIQKEQEKSLNYLKRVIYK